MLTLRRQDVQLIWSRNLETGKPILMIRYQESSFRFLRVFSQKQLAISFCQNLNKTQARQCILLDEGIKYTVWLEILTKQIASNSQIKQKESAVTRAGLLIFQSFAREIEMVLGIKQAKAFRKDLVKALRRQNIPSIESPEAVNILLTLEPMTAKQLPPWKENHVDILLRELCRLGKRYFGNTTFIDRLFENLKKSDIPERVQLLELLLKLSSLSRI
jgi:hypothetical protein